MTRQRLAIPFLLTLTLVSSILVRAGTLLGPPRRIESRRHRARQVLVNFGSCNDCHTPWKLGPRVPSLT